MSSLRQDLIRGNMLVDINGNVLPTNDKSYICTIKNCIFAYETTHRLFYIKIGDVPELRSLSFWDNEDRLLLRHKSLEKITRAFDTNVNLVLCNNNGIRYVYEYISESLKLYDQYLHGMHRTWLYMCATVIRTDMKLYNTKLTGFNHTCFWSNNVVFNAGGKMLATPFNGEIQDAYYKEAYRSTSINYALGVLINNNITMYINNGPNIVFRNKLPGKWSTAPILMKNVLYAIDMNGVIRTLASVWKHYDLFQGLVLRSEEQFYTGDLFSLESTDRSIFETESYTNLPLKSTVPIFHGLCVTGRHRPKGAKRV